MLHYFKKIINKSGRFPDFDIDGDLILQAEQAEQSALLVAAVKEQTKVLKGIATTLNRPVKNSDTGIVGEVLDSAGTTLLKGSAETSPGAIDGWIVAGRGIVLSEGQTLRLTVDGSLGFLEFDRNGLTDNSVPLQ